MSYSSPPTAPGVAGSPWPGLSWPVRGLAVAGGLTLVGLLAVAASLTPNPRGMGTHQQLGFPPCSFVMWIGRRCPACGMTTSWSCLMRGRPADALQANPGGCLLGIVALIAGPWLLLSGLRGQWLGGFPREDWLLAIALAITGVTVAHWLLLAA